MMLKTTVSRLAPLALLGSLACSLMQVRPSSAAPVFTDAPCAFSVPKAATVRCGWLSVPENRKRPEGRTIRLHVAIYRSRSARPAQHPIVWLVGGPGGRAHTLSSALFDRVVEPYLGKRDFIIFDIRGTGYSQPALDCPERDGGDPARWLPACRQRLSAVADLSCYNSAAVAADLADLRRALGIREWNVFGESYGTRLALLAMRDFPEGIRSVVLDSVVAPEADEYADGPAKFDSALSALFRDCASDRACNAAFPDLRAALHQAADQLDRDPWRLTGESYGTTYDLHFDGRAFLAAVHMALYEADLIPGIPKAIHQTLHGRDRSVWNRAVGAEAVISKALVDIGAHFSYHCSEEVPFTNAVRMQAEDERRPWQRHMFFAPQMKSACGAWLSRTGGARENLPVKSRLPVLLLAGEYDPTTPPAYAQSAASHLERGYFFILHGLGHWVTANPVTRCPHELVLEFLDHPDRRPANVCAAGLKPSWVID